MSLYDSVREPTASFVNGIPLFLVVQYRRGHLFATFVLAVVVDKFTVWIN